MENALKVCAVREKFATLRAQNKKREYDAVLNRVIREVFGVPAESYDDDADDI